MLPPYGIDNSSVLKGPGVTLIASSLTETKTLPDILHCMSDEDVFINHL